MICFVRKVHVYVYVYALYLYVYWTSISVKSILCPFCLMQITQQLLLKWRIIWALNYLVRDFSGKSPEVIIIIIYLKIIFTHQSVLSVLNLIHDLRFPEWRNLSGLNPTRFWTRNPLKVWSVHSWLKFSLQIFLEIERRFTNNLWY